MSKKPLTTNFGGIAGKLSRISRNSQSSPIQDGEDMIDQSYNIANNNSDMTTFGRSRNKRDFRIGTSRWGSSRRIGE